MKIDLPERLERYICRPDGLDGCWLWTGGKNAAGYGQAHFLLDGKRNWLAHRLAWRLLRGEAGPDHLHHTCHQRPCVNPWHLEPMDPSEHAQLHSIRQQCVHGHDMSDAYVVRRGARSGGPIVEVRMCAECKRIRSREHWRALSREDKLKDIHRRSEQRRRERKKG